MTDNDMLSGTYDPGFLHLRVFTQNQIKDLNEMLEKDPAMFSTFLHEYIHFLQNVTTTTGLQDSIQWIEYIKHVNWSVRHDSSPEFQTPFQLDNSSNVKVNRDLMAIYRGAGEKYDTPKVKYRGYFVDEVPATDMNGGTVKVKRYVVNYLDIDTTTERSYHFGYRCIKEYVAHAVQVQFQKDKVHPDIPYLLCEQIIQAECPHLPHDPRLMIAFCDACLMHYHPAEIFFETLRRMKSNNDSPSNALEIFRYTYDQVSFQLGNRVETVSSLFESQSIIAAGLFHEALKAEPLQSTYAWIRYVISAGFTLRQQRTDFMSKLVTDEGKLSKTFWEVSNFMGTPFFTDKNFNGNFINPQGFQVPKISVYIGIALIAIINVYHGRRDCSMYQFCKSKPGGDITDDRCKSMPSSRVNDAQLCPFATLWKAWGLAGKSPTAIRKI